MKQWWDEYGFEYANCPVCWGLGEVEVQRGPVS